MARRNGCRAEGFSDVTLRRYLEQKTSMKILLRVQATAGRTSETLDLVAIGDSGARNSFSMSSSISAMNGFQVAQVEETVSTLYGCLKMKTG